MPRLPVVNGDSDTWGTLLNEFLNVSHREDGTLRNCCTVANVHDFGATGNGFTDDTAAIQAAFDSVAPDGGAICMPAGTYVVTSPIIYATSSNTGGPMLVGAGRYRTRIDNRVANDAAIRMTSNVTNRFQQGGLIANLSIVTTTRPVNSAGVHLRGVWQMKLQNVRVDNLTSDGVRIECLVGDPDAPVGVVLENCYLWNNGQYGLRCTNSTGVANVSFVAVRDCMIQANAGGGIFWNGQQLLIENTGIATNRGSGGLFVSYANRANSQMVNITGTTFENNDPCHIDLESCLNGYIAGCQFTNSVGDFASSSAIYVGRPKTGIVRNLSIVNCTANVAPRFTPHTFAVVDASAEGVEIQQTRWQMYDAPGQTRYAYLPNAGLDLHLSSLHLASPMRSTDLVLVNGDNTDIDIGPEYGFLRISGPTLDFALTGFMHGYNGKMLMVVNLSGSSMTIKNEYAGSTSVNRIMTRGGIDVVLPNNQGSAWFIYNGTNMRWVYMGSN